ncbi:cupin-like domain-containing protein [Leptothoe sp. EHU-05/26/07-4]
MTSSNCSGLRFLDPVHPELLLEGFSYELIHKQYLQQGRPLLMKGLLENSDGWNLEFLRKHLGTQLFPVRQYGRERYQQEKRQWKDMGSGVSVSSLTFETYADLILNGDARKYDLYLARCSLKGTSLEKVSVLSPVEQLLKLSNPVTPENLWCGPAGHTSCLHYDPMDGTLAQLAGTKQVTLFPPSQLYNLYPFSVWNHLMHGAKRRAVYSKVYPDNPDLKVFPKFKMAMPHRIDITLQPGEMLFIPAGWWHEITSVGHGMVCSINRWWNVPLSRTFSNWSKLRAHIGSLLGIPHTLLNFVDAMASSDSRQHKLRALIQRF